MLIHPDLLSFVQQVSAERYDFFFRFETGVEVGIFFSNPLDRHRPKGNCQIISI